jgi:hypothetical protein
MTRLAFRRRTSPQVAIPRYNTSCSLRTNVKLGRRRSRNGSKEAVDAVEPRPPSGAADASEKAVIVAACEAFIGGVLKPRFLPQIRPTQWNYVIDIHGAWAAGRYRFMQRYKSGMEHNRGDEFDAPFARIDRMGPERFDIYWMRHTGKWWRLHVSVTLAEALRILGTDGVLYPV